MLFTKHDNKKLINTKKLPNKIKDGHAYEVQAKNSSIEKKKFKQCNKLQHFSSFTLICGFCSLFFHLAFVSPALMWEEQMENMITITSQTGRPCLLQSPPYQLCLSLQEVNGRQLSKGTDCLSFCQTLKSRSPHTKIDKTKFS